MSGHLFNLLFLYQPIRTKDSKQRYNNPQYVTRSLLTRGIGVFLSAHLNFSAELFFHRLIYRAEDRTAAGRRPAAALSSVETG